MGAISIAFEVIAGCNSDCDFCYNVWKDGRTCADGQLKLADIKKIFDLALFGVPVSDIFLTGGEPLLRSDLEEISRYFRTKRINVSLCTNGLLLTDRRLKNLIDAGVENYHVSLLSSDRDTHNRLCKNPKSFDAVCDAVVKIKKLNKRCHISFPATKQNIDAAGETMDMAFALGADSFSIFRFVPTGKGVLNSDIFLPAQEQLASALLCLDERMGKLGMPVYIGTPISQRHLQAPLKNIKLTRCQAGIRKFTVDFLGNLRLCEQNPNSLGNLFEKPFLLMILSKEARVFRKFAKSQEVAYDCPLLYLENLVKFVG